MTAEYVGGPDQAVLGRLVTDLSYRAGTVHISIRGTQGISMVLEVGSWPYSWFWDDPRDRRELIEWAIALQTDPHASPGVTNGREATE